MTLREIRKFRFRCDGMKPNGQVCQCDLVIEAEGTYEAEYQAVSSFGWHQDYRGWICNAGGGHRHD